MYMQEILEKLDNLIQKLKSLIDEADGENLDQKFTEDLGLALAYLKKAYDHKNMEIMELRKFYEIHCLCDGYGSVKTNKEWIELSNTFLSPENAKTFQKYLSNTGMTIFEGNPLDEPYIPRDRDFNCWD